MYYLSRCHADNLGRNSSTEKGKGAITGYTHGPGIDDLLVMRYGGGDYFYHKNHLGSIMEITNIYQATVKTYDYDAFGAILDESGSLGHNAFTYTGREYHAKSGLYYYRARFYDPAIGRFITQDPIGVAGGLNLYAYVGNDPVNWIDPLGLIELILLGKWHHNLPYLTEIAFSLEGDRYPEEVKIIQVRNLQDFQDALTNNADITKLTYLGHAGYGALAPAPGVRIDAESVRLLNKANISPDAEIFLYGCHTAEKTDAGNPSIAEAFRDHFNRDVVGWEGLLYPTKSGPKRGSILELFTAGERVFPVP